MRQVRVKRKTQRRLENSHRPMQSCAAQTPNSGPQPHKEDQQ
jgi:hypothetical protein